jgi:hypothetical protein
MMYARGKSRGLAEEMADPTRAPILHSLASEHLWTQGLGAVLLSRSLPNKRVAYVVFLVDMYCLGVKDAFGGVTTRAQYQDVYDKVVERCAMAELEPPAVRKLVEGAVEYARRLGLPPHPNYGKLKAIFAGIDPNECPKEFTYGCDGKPLFVSGPHDSTERCRQIIATLNRTCGPGNYDYLMAVPPKSIEELG